MFPLHDRTRRTLCRWIFVLLGVLPTVGVIGWSTVVSRPAHKADVCRRLGGVLGCEVRAAEVSFPRPNATLLKGLELVDPETADVVLRASWLESTYDDRALVIVASQPEIDLSHADRLWPLVDRLLRRPSSDRSIVRLSARELTLRWPASTQTLLDCALQFESSASASFAAASLRLVNESAAEPIRISLTRPRGVPQPGVSIAVDAADTPLPCSLLAALAQSDNRLGVNCAVRGKLLVIQAPDGWRGEFAGRFTDIDLNSAVSDQFPHRLGGTAELAVRHAVVHRGRLEQAQALLRAGPGIISESLLVAASKWLAMRRTAPEQAAGDRSEYTELAAEITLDAGALTIRGCCGDDASGAVLRAGDLVLLSHSADGPAPVVALVRALVPDSRLQVPATRQSDWLLRVLPVPDVVPRDPNAAPQARLRGLETAR